MTINFYPSSHLIKSIAVAAISPHNNSEYIFQDIYFCAKTDDPATYSTNLQTDNASVSVTALSGYEILGKIPAEKIPISLTGEGLSINFSVISDVLSISDSVTKYIVMGKSKEIPVNYYVLGERIISSKNFNEGKKVNIKDLKIKFNLNPYANQAQTCGLTKTGLRDALEIVFSQKSITQKHMYPVKHTVNPTLYAQPPHMFSLNDAQKIISVSKSTIPFDRAITQSSTAITVGGIEYACFLHKSNYSFTARVYTNAAGTTPALDEVNMDVIISSTGQDIPQSGNIQVQINGFITGGTPFTAIAAGDSITFPISNALLSFIVEKVSA